MASIFPTNIDLIQTNQDNIDIILADDVNLNSDAAQKAQVALGAQPVTGISDAVAYVVGVLPAPNVLGGFNGIIVNYPTPGASGTQVGWASIIATQIKAITGAANYRTQPGTTLATLRNEPYITNGASTPLTNETQIATVIGSGSLTVRPAAAAGNNGWLYFVNADGDNDYPNGTVARSNGTTWRNVAFYQSGASPAAGDLIYFDDTAKTWNRIALGSAGQFLGVGAGLPQWTTVTATAIGAIPASVGTTNGDMLVYNTGAWSRLPLGASGQVLTNLSGVVSWAAQSGVMLTSPAIWNGTTWTQYGSIQAAITAAVTGQFVVVPPGTYSENITLKTGVVVAELVAGTVTILAALSGSPTVTTAADSTLIVDRIAADQIITGTSKYPVLASHTSGTCYIKVRIIDGDYTFAANQTGYGVRITGAGGTTVVDVDEIRVTSSGDSASMHGIYALLGTVYLYANRISVSCTGASSAATGITVNGGALQGNVKQCIVASSGATADVAGIMSFSGTTGLEIGRFVISGTGLCTGVYASATSTNITITRSLAVTSALDVYGIRAAGNAATIRGTGTITTTSSGGDAFDLYEDGGTLNIYSIQYDPTKTFGTITYLTGDRMRPAQVTLFARSFS